MEGYIAAAVALLIIVLVVVRSTPTSRDKRRLRKWERRNRRSGINLLPPIDG